VAEKRPGVATLGGGPAGGMLTRHSREVSTMKRSIHIEAPVEKVFDFVKDPRNVPEGVTMPYEVTDVKLTEEGVGSYYSWVIPGLPVEGFDVYTEFVPNRRITDRSSFSMTRDFIISFEPEGSGMKLTVETGHGSFWQFPPFRQLADLLQSMIFDRFMPALKAQMEG
jgi:Polyketide cyclase / dehydrase and lipid transport